MPLASNTPAILGCAASRLQSLRSPLTPTLDTNEMQRERGFTMVETLGVVAIGAILFAFTIPGMLSFRATLRGSQAREQVNQDVRAARQAAVTQRTPVIMAFGNGVQTADITSYTVHMDTNGDRIYQSTERRFTKKMPPETQLKYVMLTPVDTLVWDISGTLWPSTLGGSLIVSSKSARETLMVSAAGMVYEP